MRGESSLSVDLRWFRTQIAGFVAVRPQYEALATTMAAVFERATEALGLHSIVEARAKSVASFAEKIGRPSKHYSEPLRELTDLCGVRIVAHTYSGVAAVCRFVEASFQIFWADSGDKLEGLAASEFGYLSRHYIVAFKPGMFPTDLVPPELVARGLKAEIQVRTILQHAWADIHHALGYKNRFPLPRAWQREFARLAAVLEEADHEFEQIRVRLDEYASSYGAYFSPERLREEIEKLEIVLEAAPPPGPKQAAATAHQLARMAMALEDWDRAIAALQPLAGHGPPGLLRDLGVSLCKRHRKEPEGSEFARGQTQLEQATKLDPQDIDAWASLGGSWRTREHATQDDAARQEYHERARDAYRRAFEIDPTNPYPLGNYIEYEIADHPDVDIVRLFHPSLEAASRRCRAQAEVGVNLPWAYFDLGKFQLLLHRPYEAFGYYAQGAEQSPAPFFLESALASFRTLERARQSLPGLDWSRGLLHRVLVLRIGPSMSRADALAPTAGSVPLAPPVVIVAGAHAEASRPEHHLLFREAFHGYRGTIISGGTQAGASALVGELQAAYPTALHTVGYVPGKMPDGVRLDSRYTEHRRTAGTGFSPLEPLQYWADLSASGVFPIDVRLLALGGGPITVSECQLALVLGASVGVLESTGTELGRCLAEPFWADHPGLERLAATPEALAGFLDRRRELR
jgi:ppGpp synthetase/RelA/SpoT-type nucleotidyltranferase